MSKYNVLTKLILSFTTAAALGATAVFSSNHQSNNPVAQLVQAPVVHADSTDQDTANTVSVSIAPEYKAAVQKYIADYKADSSNTSQLTDDINAIYAASNYTTGARRGTMKDGVISIKYTGHTQNDAKVFKVPDGIGEDAALKSMSNDETNELQNMMVNAINQIRQELGITNDTGTITLNNTASQIAKQMSDPSFSGNVNPQLDDIFKQYGVNQDVTGDQSDTDFSDKGIAQWTHTQYITFQDVKKFTLYRYITQNLFLKRNVVSTNWETDDYNNTVGKQILGITTYQLDNITKKNVKTSYVGIWEHLWQNQNKPSGAPGFHILFIPESNDSFTGTDADGNTVTNTDAQNNIASANTSDTATVGSANIPDPNKSTSTKKQTAAKKTSKKTTKKASHKKVNKKKSTKKSHKTSSKKARIVKRDKARAKKYGYHAKKNKVVNRHGKVVKHWTVKRHHLYDAYGYRIK